MIIPIDAENICFLDSTSFPDVKKKPQKNQYIKSLI